MAKGPNLTAIDPGTERVVRLFNPRRDIWGQHFGFDGPYIVGKTSVGRASAKLLRMNDPERVRVRLLLQELGEI